MYEPMYGGMNEYGGGQEVVQNPPMAYSQSPVVMLYGLNPDKMNCQKLFNVLCLYGNVMKVSSFTIHISCETFLTYLLWRHNKRSSAY